MRISGTNMETADFPYSVKAQEGFDIDTAAIDSKVDGYIAEAAEADRYSVSGLCIALGITRETLDLWRAGYVCREDEEDKRVSPNAELAQCVARGELFIHRYWEESDKSTSLHTKFLDSAGVFTPKQGRLRPPFDMGSLKKYCK